MSDILREICARKAGHVAARKQAAPLDALKARIKDAPPPAGFIAALKKHTGPALIAELKKASPSKGLIRADFDPAHIAKTYEDAGASCLSVLTDEPYFQGCDAYLEIVKQTVALPALRKDFMIDPYQIYESRVLGADCILLIMAALSDAQAADLHALATELGMDVLVEIHNREELERAKALNPAMIGVNNRNLKTLKVDTQTAFDLAEHIPGSTLKVAESGLSDAQTVQKLHESGYGAFLIGESLMKQKDIETAVHALFPKNKHKT